MIFRAYLAIFAIVGMQIAILATRPDWRLSTALFGVSMVILGCSPERQKP